MKNTIKHFKELKDPRVDRTKLYSLEAILFQTIAAILSGADNWVAIEEFGKIKEKWIAKYVDIPNGTPSHDTISDIFQRICPKHFQKLFIEWTESIATITHGEVIAIDGKTLRGSHDSYTNQRAIHMVSAWSSSNQLVLGQLKVDEKTNEIVAIPTLLELIDISGAIVTIDAMGCQKEIAKTIVSKQADYILALKQNQKELYAQVTSRIAGKTGIDTAISIEKNHGRIETRIAKVINNLQFIDEATKWKGLKTIIEITAKVHNLSKDTHSEHKRYYISSLDANAKTFNKLIRTHWEVENKLHWSLDVIFSEDASRIRKGYSAQNFSTAKRIGLNILNQQKEKGMSKPKMRYKAALSDKYRQKIMGI